MRCIIWSCPNAILGIRKSADALEGWISDKHRIIGVSTFFLFANKTREMGNPLGGEVSISVYSTLREPVVSCSCYEKIHVLFIKNAFWKED